jgi:hypothetical protein
VAPVDMLTVAAGADNVNGSHPACRPGRSSSTSPWPIPQSEQHNTTRKSIESTEISLPHKTKLTHRNAHLFVGLALGPEEDEEGGDTRLVLLLQQQPQRGLGLLHREVSPVDQRLKHLESPANETITPAKHGVNRWRWEGS